MNKAEMIDSIAEMTGLSKADSNRALDAMIATTIDSLKKGDAITLIGFGTFDIGERSARTGRNPQTGAPIDIPASKTVKFKAGKAIKEALNS